MIIFTVLGIITAVFFFVVSLMAILEAGVKRRRKEKYLWNMDKLEPLTDNELINEIQNNEE